MAPALTVTVASIGDPPPLCGEILKTSQLPSRFSFVKSSAVNIIDFKVGIFYVCINIFSVYSA